MKVVNKQQNSYQLTVDYGPVIANACVSAWRGGVRPSMGGAGGGLAARGGAQVGGRLAKAGLAGGATTPPGFGGGGASAQQQQQQGRGPGRPPRCIPISPSLPACTCRLSVPSSIAHTFHPMFILWSALAEGLTDASSSPTSGCVGVTCKDASAHQCCLWSHILLLESCSKKLAAEVLCSQSQLLRSRAAKLQLHQHEGVLSSR